MAVRLQNKMLASLQGLMRMQSMFNPDGATQHQDFLTWDQP